MVSGHVNHYLRCKFNTSLYELAEELADRLCFLRQSLATCLLLYGCDRQGLINLGMILEDEVKNLPAR